MIGLDTNVLVRYIILKNQDGCRAPCSSVADASLGFITLEKRKRRLIQRRGSIIGLTQAYETGVKMSAGGATMTVAFSLNQLLRNAPRAPTSANAGMGRAVRNTGSLHLSIQKTPPVGKHKKAVRGLIAMLDASPVVKTGGISAEISRDRDRGGA